MKRARLSQELKMNNTGFFKQTNNDEFNLSTAQFDT